MASPMASLLSIDVALREILARVSPLASEAVSIESAAGRVLARDARAAVDLPPFPSSAMDGFAVRAADTPGSLVVVDRIAAGLPASRELGDGEAMAISTGGVVPAGADAVIPIEYVVQHDNSIEIDNRTEAGAHVRPRGGDLGAGDVVVPAGTLLRTAEIGALAAAGLGEVECAVRPRAAVVTTGTELRRPGAPLEPGQIYEANGVMLAAALASAGAAVVPPASAADDEPAHRAALERGLEADVLALSFGVRGKTLVFGLPGNPVSALVCFELFVRPTLLALQGARTPGPVFARGELAASVRRNPERDELLRARSRDEGGRVLLEPLVGQESHMIARAAAADALVLAARGEGELAAGTTVSYLPLR